MLSITKDSSECGVVCFLSFLSHAAKCVYLIRHEVRLYLRSITGLVQPGLVLRYGSLHDEPEESSCCQWDWFIGVSDHF